MAPRVVLVGAPGAGKSTVGSLVAQALSVGFRDTDRDIEHTVGKPVADVFIDDGEDVFRALEVAAVASALAEHDGVLALGGGAVLSADTRDLLAAQTVVHLQVGLTDAAQREGMTAPRPVLGLNPRSALKALLDERAPLYAEVATYVVDTDGRTPDDIAASVLELL
jgi:shikimate kinase